VLAAEPEAVGRRRVRQAHLTHELLGGRSGLSQVRDASFGSRALRISHVTIKEPLLVPFKVDEQRVGTFSWNVEDASHLVNYFLLLALYFCWLQQPVVCCRG
jgi:hypothetical protein